MITQKPQPKSSVYNINAYVPGSHKGAGISEDPTIVLSANENAYGSSPHAVSAMTNAVTQVHRYQDSGATDVVAQIAQIYHLDPSCIICGNGSDELLALAISAFTEPADEVIYPQHGFLMYPISSHAVGAVPITAPEQENGTVCIDSLLAKVTPKTKMIILANPANPTGTMVSASDIKRLLDGISPYIMVILDGAYAEFVTNPSYDAGDGFVHTYPNVLMTRTFSKIYGLAGIRVGWAYGSSHMIDILHRVRGPFNVNGVAQAGAIAALKDQDFVAHCRTQNTQQRHRLVKALTDIGVPTYESHTNFVLANFGTPERANSLFQGLKNKNILVRQMGGYGFPSCLRISIGTADEMTRLIDTLRTLVQQT